jgi:hypothetical protein
MSGSAEAVAQVRILPGALFAQAENYWPAAVSVARFGKGCQLVVFGGELVMYLVGDFCLILALLL